MGFLQSTFSKGSSRRQFSFRENSCLCIWDHIQIWRIHIQRTDLCHLCLERLCPPPLPPHNIWASGVASRLNFHKPALFLAVGLWLLITITRLTSLLRTAPHTQVVKTLCCFVAIETTNAADRFTLACCKLPLKWLLCRLRFFYWKTLSVYQTM